MPHVLEELRELKKPELASRLGAIVLAPSVLIDYSIACVSEPNSCKDSISRLILNPSEFFLRTYMHEVDLQIVRANFKGALRGGYISNYEQRKIEHLINSVTPIRYSKNVEAQSRNYEYLSLYDARRLEATHAHCGSLVTCEPRHFTRAPSEIEHILRYGYADISLGEAESDEPELEHQLATVLVFTPQCLNFLLSNFDRKIEKVCRTEFLSLVDFKTSTNSTGSKASVTLRYKGVILNGSGQASGPLDAILRAIENAVSNLILLSPEGVYIRPSETEVNDSNIRVQVQLKYQDRLIQSIDSSKNIELSTARAYIGTLNIILNSENPKS